MRRYYDAGGRKGQKGNATLPGLLDRAIGLLAVLLGELGLKYLTASEDGEEFNKTQEQINKETERQLELSEKALKSQSSIGKKTKKEIEAEEQAARDKKFAKVAEDIIAYSSLTPKQLADKVRQLEEEMYNHAQNLEFEEAARIRDEIKHVQEAAMGLE